MEKYRLVHEHKAETDVDIPLPGGETAMAKFPEVRITHQGKPRNYISYAMSLFVSIKLRRLLLRKPVSPALTLFVSGTLIE